jgi:hypothetical protein
MYSNIPKPGPRFEYLREGHNAYRIFNIVMVAVLGLGIFFTLPSSVSAQSLPQFVGIDTSVSAHGFATVLYDKQTFHMTEGDSLHGFTIVLIDTTDNEIIVKHGKHLKEIRFPLQGLAHGFTQKGLQDSSH